MRETERRIREYQMMIPHLKEKIASAVLFFVMSIVMMVSVSFAWLALSTNPEVSGIETTVSSNGNLEIALSGEEGLEPNKSEVGDSGKDLVAKNLTWGNLVNLQDKNYGLHELVLRPAILNRLDLLESPLYGAEYGADGRVTELNGDFAYGNYVYNEEADMGYFQVGTENKYGVRVISSVSYEVSGEAQAAQTIMLKTAREQLDSLQKDYVNQFVGNKANQNLICELVAQFVQAKLNAKGLGNSDETDPDCTNYIEGLYEMYKDFDEYMDRAGEVMLLYANCQILAQDGSEEDFIQTVDELMTYSASSDGVFKVGDYKICLTSFAQYKKDRNNLKNTYLKQVETLNNNRETTPVKWSDLSASVYFMVDINKVKVGEGDDAIYLVALASDMDKAIEMMGNDRNLVTIEAGALRNMEARIGAGFFNLEYEEPLSITVYVKVMGKKTIYAEVYTNVDETTEFEFGVDQLYTAEEAGANVKGSNPQGKDTYGLAMDFWVRTNAAQTYLTLEGDISSKKVQRQDANGNLYWKDSSGQTYIQVESKLYDSYGGEVGTDVSDTLTKIYDIEVLGYDGVNRVWQEGTEASSVTQGKGSCYVFYADTPAEQEQFLSLLKSMSLVFVDENGKQLATAYMDTDNAYELSGKVTVPLKVSRNSMSYSVDIEMENEADGGIVATTEARYGITTLTSGVAKRITMLMYLDGESLTNDEAAVNSVLEGDLNLQFGTSTDLTSMDDIIKYDEFTIEGKVDGVDELSLTYDAADKTVDVSLEMEGIEFDEASEITACFSRYINDKQGTRLAPELKFEKISEELWTTEFTFTTPGKYLLHTIYVDGIEYKLANTVVVEMSGIDIFSSTLLVDNSQEIIVFSDEDSVTADMSVTIQEENGYAIETVQAVLLSDNGQQIIVDMSRDSEHNSVWNGNTIIQASGTYEFSTVIVNGVYLGVPTPKAVTLYLGINVTVELSETQVELSASNLTAKIKVIVKVYDNSGTEIKGLTDVSINYPQIGSTNKLFANLYWDTLSETYVDYFNVSDPGVYQFSYVSLPQGNISKTTNAPELVVTVGDPARFISVSMSDYQFAPKKDAYFEFVTENTTAVTKLRFTYEHKAVGSSEVQEVVYEESLSASKNVSVVHNDNISTWKVTLPESPGNDNQEGEWTLKSIELGNVFYEDVYYNESSMLKWDISDFNEVVDGEAKWNVHTKVVNNFTVNASTTGSDFTGLFMDDHKVSGTKLWLVDYEGEKISSIDTVTVEYQFDLTSIGLETEYQYESSTLQNATDLNMSSTYSINDNSELVQNTEYNFKYAGEYNSIFSFTYDGITYTYDNLSGVPVYTTKWDNPLVEISAITIDASENTMNVWANSQATAGSKNTGQYVTKMNTTINNGDEVKSATVYFEAIQMSKRVYTAWNKYYTEYYVMFDGPTPTVALKLQNIGTKVTSARMIFTGNQGIDESTQTATFNFGATTSGSAITSAVNIGITDSDGDTEIANWTNKVYATRYVFGKSKVNIIDIVSNGITYTIKLAVPVEINNPY